MDTNKLFHLGVALMKAQATNLLQDACPVCGRFIPQDKRMVFDKDINAAFHYACYQVYKERKRTITVDGLEIALNREIEGRY
jgi:hypothetical protein